VIGLRYAKGRATIHARDALLEFRAAANDAEAAGDHELVVFIKLSATISTFYEHASAISSGGLPALLDQLQLLTQRLHGFRQAEGVALLCVARAQRLLGWPGWQATIEEASSAFAASSDAERLAEASWLARTTTTRVTQHVRASRAAVYRALIDAKPAWQVPDGMTSEVHEMDAREGGAFRISLTYVGEGAGKTGGRTDRFHGRFVKLVPGQLVIEKMAFETSDPEMQGEMTVTYELHEVDGGTEVRAVHDGVPPGVAPADNELGWRMSLGKLAALVEGR